MPTKANRLHSVQEYYFSQKLREVRQLKAEGKPIINIGIGSPDLDPPITVSRAMQNALEQNNIHGYQSYQGLPEFRDAISNFYNKYYNVAIDPENEILPLMGSKEGIMHISMAFLNAGDQVLIPNPGYPTYTSVTNLLEAETVYYDLNDENSWYPDLVALEKSDLSKVKLMWINYPHMPTGKNATLELYEDLVTFAKKHDILLINDNPYSFILNDNPQSILSVDGAKEVALELNSLSKTFNMAGWRVGMLLGSAENIQTVLKVKSNMDSGMFYGIQQGAIAALQSDPSWFANLNIIYEKRRNIAWKIADALGCTYDKNSSGLFVWAKLPIGLTAEQTADDLLYTYDVFLAPGTIFGSNGEGYIRLSLCVTEEILMEVLQRIITEK
ncbi:aminotransferase class I/II-fold pyridoxal phosphate-dependent enzyme [Aureibaculum sp. 2210JD6-5]|uniref:pyridoxal phosphate-dependent aminotransferase n=1 Tax=Aureibaculum sp. 2210JD6-5 TaxID=3103957 RepID=UPI002AAD4CE8|nr:aminotransferase class I/II-fold pyridoxal phosphate-dependent enzyme [Aureibaculum sp. 2210JD6-5]MDY7396514.1 aminotransferase class I/II-fold pyridoxal phosphate-dependent enzyme [Aureibaculum sp. 2210JD6-5]